MSHFLSPGPQLLVGPLATANGTSGILFVSGLCERVTVVLQSAGTTSGGVITLEEAYYPVQDTPYAGTWSKLQDINASDFSGTKQELVHIVNYSIWAIRARISSDITGGGTVTIWAWAN